MAEHPGSGREFGQGQGSQQSGFGGIDYSMSTSTAIEAGNTNGQESSTAVPNIRHNNGTTSSMAHVAQTSLVNMAAQFIPGFDQEFVQNFQSANNHASGLDYSLPTKVTHESTTKYIEESTHGAPTEPQPFSHAGYGDSSMSTKFPNESAANYQDELPRPTAESAVTAERQVDTRPFGNLDTSVPTKLVDKTTSEDSSPKLKASAVRHRPAMNTKSSVILKLLRLHCKQVNIQETESSVIIECTKETKEWFMLDHLTNSKLNTVDATGDMHNKAIYTTVDDVSVDFTLSKTHVDYNEEVEQEEFAGSSDMSIVKIEPYAYEVDESEHTAVNEMILNQHIKVELRDITGSSNKRKRKLGTGSQKPRQKRKKGEVVASNLIAGQKVTRGKTAAEKKAKAMVIKKDADVKDDQAANSDDSQSTVVDKTEHADDEDAATAENEYDLFFPGMERPTCEICNKHFDSKSRLKRHVEQVHEMIKPYSCDECDKKFQSYRELQVHQRTHEDAEPFACEICGLTTKQYRKIERHIKAEHTGKKAFTCSICLRPFAYEKSLAEHKFTHPEEEAKTHQCELCGYRFLHALKLQRHMETHMKAQNYVCPVCSKQFKKLSVLRNHQLAHTDEKGFLCDKCGKAFKSPKTVAVHKKAVHFGLKPHHCATCGKSFATSYSYSRHIMIHTGEKPYVCDFCGVAHNDLSNLKKHKQSHMKEQPQHSAMRASMQHAYPPGGFMF